MRFVLDTSAIYNQFRFEGATLSLLLQTRRLGDHSVHLPEIVVHELARHFSDEVSEALAMAEKAQAKVRELTRGRYQFPTIDGDAISRDYPDWLSGRLQRLAIEVLQTPEVPIPDLLARDLRRRKPFKPSGEGFRDALIWHTILRFASITTAPEQIVFVTANKKDFADEAGNLHQHLLDDLRDLDLADRVILVTDLRRAIDTYVVPNLPPADEALQRQIQDGRVGDVDLRAWLLALGPDVLTAHLHDVPMPGGSHLRPFVRRIDSVRKVEISSARRLPDGQVIVDGRAFVQASVLRYSDRPTIETNEASSFTSFAVPRLAYQLSAVANGQSFMNAELCAVFSVLVADAKIAGGEIMDLLATGSVVEPWREPLDRWPDVG